MIKMAGMMVDESGTIVDDPNSNNYTTFYVPRATYIVKLNEEYDNMDDDLEAMSLNYAYNNTEPLLMFRKPSNPIDVAHIQTLAYVNDAPVPTVLPVLSRASSSSSLSDSDDNDTPLTQYSFDTEDYAMSPGAVATGSGWEEIVAPVELIIAN